MSGVSTKDTLPRTYEIVMLCFCDIKTPKKKSNRYDILLQYTKVRRYNKLNMNIVLPVPSSSILTVMSRISFSAVESTLLKFDMLTVKVVQPSLSA